MASKWMRGFMWAGATLASIAVLNAEIARRVEPLDLAGALHGDPNYYQWSLGRIFYAAKGQGRPVVLIHRFAVGADTYEWRRAFALLSERYRVYAYDQLGFGLSDRPDVTYQPELYVRLQRDFLRDVVGGSAIVVASGLTCAHTVLAAHLYPTLFEKLVLLQPSGAGALTTYPGLGRRLLHTVLRSPVVGELIVNILASKPSIRRALEEYTLSRLPSEEVVSTYYASSHQPGARHAIAAYVTGFLDRDIRRAFATLRQPVTVAWGREALSAPSAKAGPLVRLNPKARLVVFDGASADLAVERADGLVTLIDKLAVGELAGEAAV
jgi:pimeloyl-ACP methyl ester carboxylesterase